MKMDFSGKIPQSRLKKFENSDPSELSIFLTILPYIIAIIAVPVSSFFICKSYIFTQIFGVSITTANIYSAVVAVFLLHLMLAFYVYKSMQSSAEKAAKQD